MKQEIHASEYDVLRKGMPIDKSSEIFAAKPYLHEEGLLRMHEPVNAKRPMVQQYHERLAHQLKDATIAAVRQNFWVLQLRTLVQSVRRFIVTDLQIKSVGGQAKGEIFFVH